MGITCIRRCLIRKVTREAYDVIDKARMWALSELDDKDAKVALEQELHASMRVTEEALGRLSRYRDKYEFDRAYRLLDAVVCKAAVEEVDKDLAHLFERESELGRLSIRSAFDHLTTLAPELIDLQRAALDSREKERWAEAQLSLMRRARQIVGSKSRHRDPLVRSYLSRNIVLTYLKAENEDAGISDTPYFACLRKAHTQKQN